jgi:hypothetical protein
MDSQVHPPDKRGLFSIFPGLTSDSARRERSKSRPVNYALLPGKGMFNKVGKRPCAWEPPDPYNRSPLA